MPLRRVHAGDQLDKPVSTPAVRFNQFVCHAPISSAVGLDSLVDSAAWRPAQRHVACHGSPAADITPRTEHGSAAQTEER
jgi:hypothetical protein